LAGLLSLAGLPLALTARPLSEPPARSLEFIENKGQWDARARYAAPLHAGRLFLETTGFTYSFVDPQQLAAHHHHGKGPEMPVSDKLRAHAYSMRFVDARSGVRLQPQEATGEVRNYLLGNDARHWAAGVGGYRQLRYQGLWQGIDAHLYENRQGQLEYDFELAAKADPDRIRLRYDGVSRLSLRADGALEIGTSVGQVTELAPQAYQLDAAGHRQPVSCRYVLKGQEVRFELGSYDHKRPLVIDPTVLFSSFTGSTADNWGFTATYDQQGNMYSGGIVFAPGYPTSAGAFDASFSGVVDMGIIKYNAATTGPASRVWATYIGGAQADVPHSMVVNSQGDLLVLGTTSSNNYPVTGNGYDRSFNGGNNFSPLGGIAYTSGSDLVVTRLTANGAGLVGSTFLGGSGNDGLLTSTGAFNQLVHNYGDQFRGDITVDADDNVYLASSTSSQNFPTVNPVQGAHRGGTFDAVVARFSPTLDALTWSSYFGGSGLDAAYSIQLNAARDIYIGGGSTSSDLTPTAGAVQGSRQGDTDGYILRLTPTAGRAAYQAQRVTYLGTTQYDQVYFLQVDDQGGVYALGQTRGSWPIVGNVYQRANGRQFIQKLAPDLGSIVLSTAFGTGRTNPDISPTAFLVDQCERIYVCGWGGDINQGSPYANEDVRGLPVSGNALQANTDGNDFYLLQLTPYAGALEYATFFGGNGEEHVDGGTSRFDRRGFVYQAVCGGCGGSSSFPIPPGAGSYSTRNNAGNCNNAAFKIDFGINAAVAGPNRSICVDAAAFRLAGAPAGGTWTGTGVTGNATAGYTFTPATAAVGTHTLTYSVASTGTCVTTSTLTMTVRPITPVNFVLPQQICRDETPLRLAATPAGGTFSGPGVSNGEFNPRAAGPGRHTITYTLPELQCGMAQQQILVNDLPVVVAGRDTALCAFQRSAYQLRGTPAGGTWSGPGCTPAGLFTPPVSSGPVTLTYTYRAPTGCLNAADLRVMLVPEDRTNKPLDLPTCPIKPRSQEGLPYYTGIAPFTHTFNHDLLFATRYEWNFGDAPVGTVQSTEQFPVHTYEKPGTYRVSFTAYYNSSCQSTTRFAPVYVGDPFMPNIITPNGDSINDSFEQRLSCLPVTLKVFSRWGNQVYESKDYRNNWGGSGLPDGVYYYHLTDPKGRKAKGWLEIRR
jgi:gliding motility-associated-like protein